MDLRLSSGTIAKRLQHCVHIFQQKVKCVYVGDDVSRNPNQTFEALSPNCLTMLCLFGQGSYARSFPPQAAFLSFFISATHIARLALSLLGATGIQWPIDVTHWRKTKQTVSVTRGYFAGLSTTLSLTAETIASNEAISKLSFRIDNFLWGTTSSCETVCTTAQC